MKTLLAWALIAFLAYIVFQLIFRRSRSPSEYLYESAYPALPRSHKRHLAGFWWNRPPMVALAAGQGWNMEVKGESFRQSELLDIVGGRGQYGCTVHTTAHLGTPDDIPDHPEAVSVMIDGKLVGYLPSVVGDQIRGELAALPGAEDGVTCKAAVVGGWDQMANGGERGHFGVKLSLSRPLKIRTK